YDPANRLTSRTPAAAQGASLSVVLDGGDTFAYDPLSRLTSAQRQTPDQRVRTENWDRGGRPLDEVVGDRQPLARNFDAFDNPTETQLPGGRVHAAGQVMGWQRAFDQLDRQRSVGPLGSGAPASGATWAWGGANRLYRMTTTGGLGTEA